LRRFWPLCAEIDGFSLHAGVRVQAHERGWSGRAATSRDRQRALRRGPDAASCPLGVVHQGQGSAMVTVARPDGRKRVNEILDAVVSGG
jgi:hypothetical protein